MVSDGIYMFTFAKPDDFVFTAGQYVFLDFDNPTYTDDRPSMRAMSIASAPEEDHLLFVMHASESAFKKNIVHMNEGDSIIVKGPLGHIALPEDDHKPIVFLISGVGITAARAIIKHEEYRQSQRNITVLYSSRTKNTMIFGTECDQFTLPNLKMVHTLTREEGQWDGERGRIDKDMIARNIDDMENSMYYVVGAGAFIESMRDTLLDMGIDTSHIQFDNFG